VQMRVEVRGCCHLQTAASIGLDIQRLARALEIICQPVQERGIETHLRSGALERIARTRAA